MTYNKSVSQLSNGYELTRIKEDIEGIVTAITTEGIELPIPDIPTKKDLANMYKQCSRAHGIDKDGVFVYEPRLYRPFVHFPFGRQCLQWEFDRFCYNNPETRYNIFDLNAGSMDGMG